MSVAVVLGTVPAARAYMACGNQSPGVRGQYVCSNDVALRYTGRPVAPVVNAAGRWWQNIQLQLTTRRYLGTKLTQYLAFVLLFVWISLMNDNRCQLTECLCYKQVLVLANLRLNTTGKSPGCKARLAAAVPY